MSISISQKIGLVEEIEARGMLDFFRAAPPQFVAEHGLYVEEAPSYVATQVRQSEELRQFNSVFALGVRAPATLADLAHLVSLYQREGLMFNVRLSRHARPAELPLWLDALGFAFESNSAKFYRDVGTEVAASPSSNDFRIERVGTAHAMDFVRIACLETNRLLQSWLTSTVGRAGWQHYLAFYEDVPVATGVLYIEDSVGHLGWAATLPAYRRRGAQNALLAHRIREAVGLGCKLLSADANEVTPEKPNSSYHNLLRNGFQLAYLRPKFVYNHHVQHEK